MCVVSSNNGIMDRGFKRKKIFPSQVQDLFDYLKSLGSSVKVKVVSFRSPYTFLVKKTPRGSMLKVPNKITISISDNPEFYTIEVLEPSLDNTGGIKYKETFNVKVYGDIRGINIQKDVEDVLNGKLRAKFNATYPF